MHKLFRILLVSSIYLFTGNAQASLVTLYGNTVSFEFDNTLTGLFGSANISGDTLYFTPSAFTASAQNTDGVVLNNSTLNVKVQALNLQDKINNVSVIEKGDYFSFGDTTLVGIGGHVRAFDINKPNGDVTKSIVANDPFSHTAFLQTNNWQTDTILDTTELGSGYINVTITNLLGAISGSLGQAAFIETNYVGLTTVTDISLPAAIPLPATIWLLGAALVGLISSTKRNKEI